MKKILVINTKYQITGGEDSNIVDEIKFLQKYYEVEYLEFNNSKIGIFELFSFFLTSNFKSNKDLKQRLSKFKPDLVYIHNTWFKANLGIFKVLKNQDIETVVKIHNFRYYCAKSYLIKNHIKEDRKCSACNLDRKSSKILNKYFTDSTWKSLILVRFTRKFITILKQQNLKILTITKFHKQFLLDLGIAERKISLYPNPIEIRDKNIKKKKAESDYVLYAGRLSKDKGLEELLKSWKKASIQNLNLKIIGVGPLENKLKNEYLDSNILFLGYLDNDAVLKEIENARAVVTATKMYEGQPRLLCEASSLGTPAIYPSFGGMDEFFPNDYMFSFKQFDYEDLIQKLNGLNDKEMIEKESSRVFTFISEKLKATKMINDFQEAIKH